MRITLVGSRHFGATTLDMLRQHGVEIARVVVADREDRLAAAAKAAGIDVVVQADPKLVVASEIAEGTELIVTAHSHARISKEALATARQEGRDRARVVGACAGAARPKTARRGHRLRQDPSRAAGKAAGRTVCDQGACPVATLDSPAVHFSPKGHVFAFSRTLEFTSM